MNKHLQRFLLLAIFCLANIAFAQAQGTVSGKVLNQKDKQPIDYASIAIKKLSADSAVVGSTSTGATGSFSVGNIATGKYRLYVVYLGLKSINKDFELTAAKPSINFGELLMEDTGVTLQGVEIKGETPPVVVKKDTLEINASTLKVKENSVVEDLLKKVPGVEVAKDGTVTTQGETIKRVRVDGKDFMGNDPLLATRNLPADMVDKIQIIDDMSEQSKFSGVDDGNREKILNIVTKNGVKNKGYIGNTTVGYGTDERHDVNINLNRFDGSQRITLLGQFNNVNKQNFGGGVGGGGGGRGQMFGGGGGGQQQQGITTTSAGGIDFADTFDDGMQFNGSYFFNKTSLFNTNVSSTQRFLSNNRTTTSLENSESTTERLNHRLNFMIDTKLDSATSIRIQPNISYTDNSANSFSSYDRMNTAGNAVGTQNLITGSKAPSISNNLLLRRKFLRRGRTLSLNVNTNINDSEADNFNKNPETLDGLPNRNLDQLTNNNVNSFSNTARLVYTEPLSKTLSLEFNLQNVYMHDNRQRLVYDFNNGTQQYDVVNIDYSNEFENTTWTNALGFSLNKNEKKYNWNVGVAGQLTNRTNDNLTTGFLFKQDFFNITPSAQFRYNFSNSKRLNVRYDGRTNQPSIDQIQPVRDNTNTQTVPLGNPNLKPSFSNNLRIFYNNFDFASYRTLFLGAFITQTFNDFGNAQREITEAGEDLGKIENGYVNVKGNYSANLFGSLGLPIIKGNKLNFQIDGGLSASQGTNVTEGLENVTKSIGLRNGYKLVSNMDKLDLIAGVSGRWDRSNYTIGQTTNFYTLSPNIDISYMFPGNIRLQTDVTYNSLTGRGAANADYTQVNAYISRQFFKNKGTFKLSVNDLFNENTGVIRNANANAIVDQNFNVLKRYFMFSFTYALSTIAGMSPQQQQGRGPGNFRMGGPGRM